MKKNFICAGKQYTTLENYVAAPYLRRSFILTSVPEKAVLRVCGLGFYRFFVNGHEITKGALAPYISNPDHVIYYDEYDISGFLTDGENVFGALLGNGFMNNPGGYIWDFDKVPWRSSPILAVEFESDGFTLITDTSWRCKESPITFDDLRMGEDYDFRLEIPGWNEPGFDDSSWTAAATPSRIPLGEMLHCTAEPVINEKELKPVSITLTPDGYLYDMGENTAGVFRLTVKGTANQTITLKMGEWLTDGAFTTENIWSDRKQPELWNTRGYTCNITLSGNGIESCMPSFTYFGCRYILVKGITPEQAVPELLTFIVQHSDLREIGGFSCSDETVNLLMSMVRRTDLANFFYFPTDCPHREKNGWTGDASVSSAHVTYLFDTRKSYRQWLKDICLTQNTEGALPGIVPTDTWGFAWGNGPAWDSVLFTLPYHLYKKFGDIETTRECAPAMIKYLKYIMSKREKDGTVSIGLGDWVPVFGPGWVYDTPTKVTSSIYVLSMAQKAAELMNAAGLSEEAEYAEKVYYEMRSAIRKNLIDYSDMSVLSRTQTAQAMALYYGVFEKDENKAAFERLMEAIHLRGDVFDCGMLGLHCLFHVLAGNGKTEFAYKLIMNDHFPSFKLLPEFGYTSFPEKFNIPDDEYDRQGSHNHHLFCDVARFFIESVAGLYIDSADTITVQPCFVSSLNNARAWHEFDCGTAEVAWERKGSTVHVTVRCPEELNLRMQIPDGAEVTLIRQE